MDDYGPELSSPELQEDLGLERSFAWCQSDQHFQQSNPTDNTRPEAKQLSRSRKARILVLHGHGQSAAHMQTKTKFLTSILQKAIPASSQNQTSPGGFEFVYATAPNRVRLPDMKGEIDGGMDVEVGVGTESCTKTDYNMWAWGFGDYTSEEIKHCDRSLRYLLRVMKTEGEFAGVMGFSTGATTALILLSLAERGAADEIMQHWGLDSSMLPSQPFGFGIFFSGCTLSHSLYKSFFYPRLETPILHFIGEHDTHLPRCEMAKFSNRCKNSRTVYHPGCHFVPRYRSCQDEIVAFMQEQMLRLENLRIARHKAIPATILNRVITL